MLSPQPVEHDLSTTITLFGVSGSVVDMRVPDSERDGTVSGLRYG